MTLAVIFLVIGAAALAYGFLHLMGASSGWQQIEAESSREPSCAGEFILYYDIGAGEMSARAEKRELTSLYSEAARTAYVLFDADVDYPDRHNVRYLNQHPNEVVDVEPALYTALETVQSSGDRSLYLAPVYEIYNGIFTCQEQAQTADYDPRQNQSLAEYFEQCAGFARDPSAVDVELLGDGNVRLNVSEAYLAFAREEQIERFIDFCWMKNAFIADYIAGVLIENGCTRGALSSRDGFVRNLSGAEGEQFGFNIYDGSAELPLPAATMVYSGGISIVYLHSYPLSSSDSYWYRTLSDGQVRTAYLDVRDGLCRSAVEDLVGYSRSESCGEVLLRMIPVYVADALSPEALQALAGDGIYTIYCQDQTVIGSDSALELTSLYQTDDVQYTSQIPAA